MGVTLEVRPIKTILNGLCYKFMFENHLPKNFNESLKFLITRYNKNLKKIQLTIAAENTWQGIIEQRWPYSYIPHVITKKFHPESLHQISVNIEENIYKYRNGMLDFDECFKHQQASQCASIFDPRLSLNQ